MPEIKDSENGAYIDRLTVVYHSVDGPGQPPRETVVLVVDGGTSVNRNEIRREVQQIHMRRDADGHLQENVPFVLDERYTQVSWGASGAFLEFVVQASSYGVQGIVGGAAYAALLSIGQRIRPQRQPGQLARPIDDQLAVRRAKEIAATNFTDVSQSSLTLLSVALVDATATVVLRGEDGSTFTVQPSLFDGGAIGPIIRAYPESKFG